MAERRSKGGCSDLDGAAVSVNVPHQRKCEFCERIFWFKWKPGELHNGKGREEFTCPECRKNPKAKGSDTVTLYKHGKAAFATGLRFRGRLR